MSSACRYVAYPEHGYYERRAYPNYGYYDDNQRYRHYNREWRDHRFDRY